MTCTELENAENTCVNAAAALADEINTLSGDVSIERIACYGADSGAPVPLTLSAATIRKEQLQAAQPPDATKIEAYTDLIDVLSPHDAKVQERATNLAVAAAYHDKREEQNCI